MNTASAGTLVVFAHRGENRLPEKKHPGVDRLVTGQGKNQSVRALEKRLDSRRYERIVNIGVCGALDPSIPLSACFAIERVECDPPSPERSSGMLPAPSFATGTFSRGVLVTVERPVVSIAERERLRAQGPSLVDMECYHLFQAASSRGIPFYAFKTVADHADGWAFIRCRLNAARASGTLCRRLWPWLGGGRGES
jgi:nucleoside phosphorylase